jgi:hypothetical protein
MFKMWRGFSFPLKKSVAGSTYSTKQHSSIIYPSHSLMELGPSCEAANCAATQEIPSILWNAKVHYNVSFHYFQSTETISLSLKEIKCRFH